MLLMRKGHLPTAFEIGFSDLEKNSLKWNICPSIEKV